MDDPLKDIIENTLKMMDDFREEILSVFPGKITRLTEWMVVCALAQKQFKMSKKEADEFTELCIKEHNQIVGK